MPVATADRCPAVEGQHFRHRLQKPSPGANVAFFHLVLFAFDLAHWFKRLCLPPEYLHATLETLRTDLLVVPARLVRRANRNVLHLPRDYRHRELFERAFQRARRLKLPAKS